MNPSSSVSSKNCRMPSSDFKIVKVIHFSYNKKMWLMIEVRHFGSGSRVRIAHRKRNIDKREGFTVVHCKIEPFSDNKKSPKIFLLQYMNLKIYLI